MTGDMTGSMTGGPTGGPTGGYRRQMSIDAPPADVFRALTTRHGLASWWTPVITGDPDVGGDVDFHFDEQMITMHVVSSRPAEMVEWTCLTHSKFPEWNGTSIEFGLSGGSEGRTDLSFAHVGLVPACDCYDRCSNGWDRYLSSLADHASGRPGRPWQRSFSTGAR